MVTLFQNFSNLSCTYCATTFTDSELKTFLHRDRLDQLNSEVGVITRHHHFSTCIQFHFTSNVCCTEVELRTVFVEEWSMTATFFFAQHVNFTFEVSMRSDRSWFAQNHTTTNLILFNTTKQQTGVVTSFTFVEQFLEHFNTGNGRSQ